MLYQTRPFARALAIAILLASNLPAQPDQTNLALWFDANDASTIFDDLGNNPGDFGFTGNVSRWDDKSPSGNSVVVGEGQPTYVTGVQNGKPTVRFDGREHMIDTSPAGLPLENEKRHLLFAGIPTAMPEVNTYLNYGTRGAGSVWFNTFLYDNDNNDVGRSYYTGWGNDVESPNDLTDIDDRVILEFVYDQTNGTWYRNGKLDFEQAYGGLNTDLVDLRVGTEDGGASLSNWDMLEILVYGEALGPGQRNQVGSYLSQKWDIAYLAVETPTSFEWNVDGAGNWFEPSNWTPRTGGPPNGNHDATFGSIIKAGSTVFADQAVTARRIDFENQNTYAIAGVGGVNLAAGSNPVVAINVVHGHHEFQTRVALHSDTVVDVASDQSLVFNNALDLLGNTLTKTGAGDVAFNNNITTGSGIVDCAEGTCSGTGTISGDLNNGGGTVAPGNSPGASALNSAGSLTAVPEPAAWIICCLGLLGLLGLLPYTQLRG